MPASTATPALIHRTPFQAVTLIIGWLVRVALGVFFLTVGCRMLVSHSMWVTIFDRFGAPTWLRYLTGTLQVGGAVLLLVPRTFLIGACLIGGTMAGAIYAWTAVLREPRSAIIPATILTILAVCVIQHVRLARSPDR